MVKKWYKQPSQKACVVGLDGVPHSMITRFTEAGVMPNLRDIASRGRITSMSVTLPEISSVSWSSFMTGKNPGEHGIFGFTDLREGSYKQTFPSFRDLKTETIWDRIGEAGMSSVVINQPATYPARPIHGALVSGFVAVKLDRSVFPSKYLRLVRDLDYQIDVDAGEVRDDPPKLFKALAELLDSRKRLFDALWDSEKWNLMEVIVTGTDRLHHFIWDAYEDEAHPHHGDFLDYYRRVDDFIGHVYDKFRRLDCGDNFFLLSDHGFCQTKKEVYVNSVLTDLGYLQFESSDSNSLEDISEKSTAFALDPARIYIHRSGRFPRGSVAEDEVDELKEELTSVFEGLDDGNDTIVRKVFYGADVYTGPHADKGPDLLLVPNNGYDFKGRIGAPAAFGERRLQGMHTWDDAFFVTLRPDLMPETDDFNLLDIPPQILSSLDVT
ncbi:MAG: alkaline phosphatase family protein [Candidatus Krumholzibacteria bacterium]|nr:alkaline phosphatase family protein [Candidatus Krumholzibacteria bacterium]